MKYVNVENSLANRRYKYALLKKVVPYRTTRRLANWSWSHIIQYLMANMLYIVSQDRNIDIDFYADTYNRQLEIYFEKSDLDLIAGVEQ